MKQVRKPKDELIEVDEAKLAVDLEDVDDREAIVEFLGTLDRCRDHLVILNQVVEDHLGLAPERVTWASVGDAQRLRNQLNEIVTWTRPLVMSKDEADRLVEEETPRFVICTDQQRPEAERIMRQGPAEEVQG